jgi:hypothetical protein
VCKSSHEQFVDSYAAAEFANLSRRRLLELARSGDIPAYSLGDKRKTWLFRLSELSRAIGRNSSGRSGSGLKYAAVVPPAAPEKQK